MLEIQATRDRAADELAATTEQIAELEAALAGAKAEAAAASPRTRPEPWPRCTTPTPGCPRSPRNSPGSVRRRGRRRPRPTGWTGSGRPPKLARDQHRSSAVRPGEPAVRRRVRGGAGRGRPGRAGRTGRADGVRPAAGGGGPAGPAHRRGTGQGHRRQRRVAAPGGPTGTAAPGPGRRRRGAAHRQFGGRHPGRRGGPPGRRAARASRWPRPPPNGTGRRQRGPARTPRSPRPGPGPSDLQVQWDRLTDAVHSGEVLRAQQTLQAEQLADPIASRSSRSRPTS